MPTKQLTAKDIIHIMREEWDTRINNVLTEAGIDVKADIDNDDKQEQLVSPELKVVNKNSKVRYTVDSVGPRDVILRTPEGDKMLVSAEDLEKEYEIA